MCNTARAAPLLAQVSATTKKRLTVRAMQGLQGGAAVVQVRNLCWYRGCSGRQHMVGCPPPPHHRSPSCNSPRSLAYSTRLERRVSAMLVGPCIQFVFRLLCQAVAHSAPAELLARVCCLVAPLCPQALAANLRELQQVVQQQQQEVQQAQDRSVDAQQGVWLWVANTGRAHGLGLRTLCGCTSLRIKLLNQLSNRHAPADAALCCAATTAFSSSCKAATTSATAASGCCCKQRPRSSHCSSSWSS